MGVGYISDGIKSGYTTTSCILKWYWNTTDTMALMENNTRVEFIPPEIGPSNLKSDMNLVY